MIVHVERVKKRIYSRTQTKHYKVKMQLGKTTKTFGILYSDVPSFHDAFSVEETEE